MNNPLRKRSLQFGLLTGLGLAAVSWLGASSFGAPHDASRRPPNFVLVLGEGHRWSSLSVPMDDAVPDSKSSFVPSQVRSRIMQCSWTKLGFGVSLAIALVATSAVVAADSASGNNLAFRSSSSGASSGASSGDSLSNTSRSTSFTEDGKKVTITESTGSRSTGSRNAVFRRCEQESGQRASAAVT